MGILDGGLGGSMKELAQVLNDLISKKKDSDDNINYKTNVCVDNIEVYIKDRFLTYCMAGKTCAEAKKMIYQELFELYTSENGERVNKIVEALGKMDNYFKKDLYTHNQTPGNQM